MISRYTLPEIGNIWSEENKFTKMLELEIMICEAWNKKGIIPDSALENIKKRAKFDIERIKEIEKITNHDIVAFVSNVAESIGEDGRYVHIGATSSDIIDTTLALQMVEAADRIIESLNKLKDVLKEKAILLKDTLTIGRTHGIHAEPTSFGLKFALMYTETTDNIRRMHMVKEEISVGKLSGAVGNYANTDPFIEEYVLKKMNLKPATVSTQIIQRDRHALYLNVIALIGSSLEKFSTEIRNLQKTETSELEEPFGVGQKGSSAMPHKRNPIICERICGLARVLRGYSVTSLENIALWHERDISHSSAERVIVPDSTILLDYMINKFIYVVEKLKINYDNINRNLLLTHGLFYSERILTYLVKNGFSREEAYKIIQTASFKSIEDNIDFKEKLQEEISNDKRIIWEEINKLFDPEWFLRHVDFIYRRAGLLK